MKSLVKGCVQSLKSVCHYSRSPLMVRSYVLNCQ